MTTAAALIIGDEILGGKFADRNGPWLIAWLRERGIELRSMSYLPDERDVIAQAIARLAPCHDWIFTSGGVGPTHDDVTFDAVAVGMGRALQRDPEIVRVLSERMRSELNEAAMRMAEIPAGSALWWEGEIAYPVVVAGNVVVLPGLPGLFRSKLEAVAHRFEGRVPARRVVYTRWYESHFATELGALAARSPGVKIGSYPRTNPNQPWRVQLQLEGHDPVALDACEAALLTLLGDSVVQLEDPLGQP
jgi:molybdenum cofactor synthesis domain-containing protein